MYLNTFNKKVVLELWEELQQSNIPELVFACHCGKSYIEKAEYLCLHYSPHFHQLLLDVVDLNKPIYTNPDAIAELVPIERFKKKLIPNGFYNETFKQH